MSKLSNFLSKSRKKPAAKQAATQAEDLVTSPQPELSVPVVTATQPKLLEQWGGDDEEVVINTAPAVDLRAPDEDDEDEEIDLPSNKVKGNFEWKKAGPAEDALSEQQKDQEMRAKLEQERVSKTGLMYKKNTHVLGLQDSSQFPELGAETKKPEVWKSIVSAQHQTASVAKDSASTTTAVIKPKKSSKSSKAAPESIDEPIARKLVADDIWEVICRIPISWPRPQLDEVACRARYQNLLGEVVTHPDGTE